MHCSRVDAFRHRAAVIIAHPAAGSHVYRWLTLTAAIKRVARDKRRPPRIVTDISRRARRRESGGGEFCQHLRLAIALQTDAAAQLPVVRQRGRGKPVERVPEKAVARRKAQ